MATTITASSFTRRFTSIRSSTYDIAFICHPLLLGLIVDVVSYTDRIALDDISDVLRSDFVRYTIQGWFATPLTVYHLLP
jgi:hypothetical protein